MSDEIKNLGNETPKAAAGELSESELDAVAGGDQQVAMSMQTMSNILRIQHDIRQAIIQNIRG